MWENCDEFDINQFKAKQQMTTYWVSDLYEQLIGSVDVLLGVGVGGVVRHRVQVVEGDHDQVARVGTHQDLVLDCHDH